MGLSGNWAWEGPCDGVGGAIKKSANIAVKSGTVISDGNSFFPGLTNHLTPFHVYLCELQMWHMLNVHYARPNLLLVYLSAIALGHLMASCT